MKFILIKDGNIVSDGKIHKGSVLIADGKIECSNYSGELRPEFEIIDASYKFISPGFIDMHLHGGDGYDFMDCTVEAFEKISQLHLKKGATTIVPTAVSSSVSSILRLIDVCKHAKKTCKNIFGLHLEGPYISKQQKGAHKEKYLHSPNKSETELLLSTGNGIINRITAAPELDNMIDFAKTMIENGVLLSLGHSDATSDIALKAFDYGFSHVTHLYSATPSIRKINQNVMAGVVEAAYLNDNVTVELIADGKHAAVDALKLAVKIKGSDNVALVTDALRPAGCNVSESYLGEKIPENRVIIEDGVAKLPDRSTFAGSIATSDILLKKGVLHYGLSIEETVKMITKTPARILGLTDRGSIKTGLNADIVVFDENFNICTVIKNGEII